jgi:two-component system sensor histidine kinase HydH
METSSDSGLLVQKDSRLIVSEVDRLSLWIKDLLKYSSNAKPVDNIDLIKIGAEQIENFERTTSLSRKSIKFVFETTISSAVIRADATHIYHMFNSLFANAIDAISDRGEITLSISRLDSSQIIISLTDNGIGMTADLQHRIFEPNVSGKLGGLGVGLSLVKRITERHNATISVRSRPNKGSTFSVTFYCEDKETN